MHTSRCKKKKRDGWMDMHTVVIGNDRICARQARDSGTGACKVLDLIYFMDFIYFKRPASCQLCDEFIDWLLCRTPRQKVPKPLPSVASHAPRRASL